MQKSCQEKIKQWPTISDIDYLFDKAMKYQVKFYANKDLEALQMYKAYMSCYFSCMNSLFSMTIDDIADQFCMITIFSFNDKDFLERYDLMIETYNELIKKGDNKKLHKIIDWLKYGGKE